MEQLFTNATLSLQDFHNWMIAGSVLIVCTGVWFYHRRNDNHVLERAVAKKKERQEVADIVSAALQDAAHQGKISSEVWHKYNKKLGVALNLPDMIPRKPFNERIAKSLAFMRLRENNIVHIAGKLANIRRSRSQNKQNRVRAKAARKVS